MSRSAGITLVGRHFPSFVPHSRNYGGQAGDFGLGPYPGAKTLGYSVLPFHGKGASRLAASPYRRVAHTTLLRPQLQKPSSRLV